MKVIRIDSAADTRPITGAIMSESSLRPDRRPLFLPDGQWVCEIRLAIHVSRLGKAISAKFAPRYYTEYTVVNYMRPATGGDAITDNLMDDAIVHGAWQPLDNLPETVRIDNTDVETDFCNTIVDSLIEHLSARMTFKTGDILILPRTLFSYVPAINRTITVEALPDLHHLLEFTIK